MDQGANRLKPVGASFTIFPKPDNRGILLKVTVLRVMYLLIPCRTVNIDLTHAMCITPARPDSSKVDGYLAVLVARSRK